MKKQFTKPKLTVLVNPLNSETWYCKDYSNLKNIDGVSYVTVFKPENENRTFLMRKDALKVTTKSYS
jgi:hypothetical protein